MPIVTTLQRWLVIVSAGTLLFARTSAGFRNTVFAMKKGTYLSALIFAPPWEEGAFSGVEEEDGNADTGPVALMENLSRDQGAALTRLAAAFSPVGHHLDLKDIEHVSVISVDEHHIDIQAVVCEVDGCVTIAVPISFPTPCHSTGIEDCVMDNLGLLDVQASEKLIEMEWNSAHDAAKQNCWSDLTSQTNVNLPTWWVPPNQMSDECDNVRRLLNDEGFQPEVKALATQGLSMVDGGSDFVVEHAAIAAVCPTGVYMRAKATHYRHFQEAEEKIVEIPVYFGHEVKDIESLRAAILGVVAAASSYAGLDNDSVSE